jgi:protein-L-isoaspartate O-methyltransferase
LGLVNENTELLRGTFNSVAAIYDEVRPCYPAALFDDLVRLAELKPGDRLLEIGCATGKATLPLPRRGLSVMCIELGANLAALAGSPIRRTSG